MKLQHQTNVKMKQQHKKQTKCQDETAKKCNNPETLTQRTGKN